MALPPTTVTVVADPSADRYQYEYRNQWTRGWVRAQFDPHELPVDWASGVEATCRKAGGWTSGTELRLVEIDEAGNERVSHVCGVGTMRKP